MSQKAMPKSGRDRKILQFMAYNLVKYQYF